MAQCFFCGADTATEWRRPGHLSKLPAHLRGRFGYCAEHAAEADAKLSAAIGLGNHHPPQGREAVQPEPRSGGKVRSDKHDPGKQGQLI